MLGMKRSRSSRTQPAERSPPSRDAGDSICARYGLQQAPVFQHRCRRHFICSHALKSHRMRSHWWQRQCRLQRKREKCPGFRQCASFEDTWKRMFVFLSSTFTAWERKAWPPTTHWPKAADRSLSFEIWGFVPAFPCGLSDKAILFVESIDRRPRSTQALRHSCFAASADWITKHPPV